jgi:hypothetical protein
VTDTRTLRLAQYLSPALPEPPAAQDWTRGLTAWGMMCNDRLGCCTIAGAAHAIQVWTANTGVMQTVPDSAIEQYYAAWDGYVPGDPESDQGGIAMAVLKAWKKQGMAGNQLLAFAGANVRNLIEVRQAIHLFGGVYLGVNLPRTAQRQEVWEVEDTAGADAVSGSWGGHCVFVPSYDAQSFTCITWGGLKAMTVAFWQTYCDEAYALLDASWVIAQRAPSGFDRAQLMADLQLIR